MALSQEQLELRKHTIGASEIAAVCGVHPWATKTDVWMRKETPTRPPLDTKELTGDAIDAGKFLEDGIRKLYAERFNVKVRKVNKSRIHKKFSYISATPDGLVSDGRGLEIKLVGRYTVMDWEYCKPGTVPIYVDMQAQQNMEVYGRDSWDVAACFCGTQFRFFTVHRDQPMIDFMLETAGEFWNNNILKDIPPEDDDPEVRLKLYQALFANVEGKEVVETDDPVRFEALCRQYAERSDIAKQAEQAAKETRAELCKMVGNNYGLKSEVGSFLWYPVAGKTNWKYVAEKLAKGGKIPQSLIEESKGAGSRTARFFPSESSGLKPEKVKETD